MINSPSCLRFLLAFLGLSIFTSVNAQVNDCHYNLALSDSCQTAPMFCMEYLGGLCASNQSATSDTLGLDSLNCSIDNNVWMRIPVCDSTLSFSLYANNCLNDEGLEISIWETMDCDTFNLLSDSCQIVASNEVDTLNFAGLSPGTIYYLMIDGLNADFCDFEIHGISGIYTTPLDTINPPGDTTHYVLTEISPAMIDGPDFFCIGVPVMFTFIPPVCDFQEGDCGMNAPVFGGEKMQADDDCFGSSLCAGPSIGLDTIINWTFPPGIEFQGDSTGFTVTVMAIEDYLDQYLQDTVPPNGSTDTIYMDYMAEMVVVPVQDTTDNDADVYCDCTGNTFACGSCGGSASGSSGIIVEFNYENYTVCPWDCVLTACGTICGGGGATCVTPCVYNIVTVFELQEQYVQETYFINDPSECVSTSMGLLCGPGSFFDYDPNFPPCGIYYDVTIILCPQDVEYLGSVSLCPGDCYTAGDGSNLCAPGTYSWTIFNGSCDVEQSIDIFYFQDNAPVDLGTIILCEGECYQHEGVDYCSDGLQTVISFDANGCVEQTTFTIVIEAASVVTIGPLTEVCSQDGTTYSVSFSISGGTPPYAVNGQPIIGNFYTETGYPTGSNYYFEIKDNAQCQATEVLAGLFDCPQCPVEPGKLLVDAQQHCPSGAVKILELEPADPEPWQEVQYWIHDGPDPATSNIIAMNETGEWSYNPTLFVIGNDYFSSRVVGPLLGGLIDLNSICTDFTPGPTIIFYDYPQLELPANNVLLNCEEETYTIWGIPTGGSGIFNHAWQENASTFSTDIQITLSTEGQYELIITDYHTGCSTVDAVVVVEEKNNPVFDLGSDLTINCALENATLSAQSTADMSQVSWSMNGPDGTITGVNPLNNYSVSSPGWYYFEAIDAISLCSYEDSVLINPADPPTAVAADVQTRKCPADEDLASLTIDAVTGGTAPYDIWLDGQPMALNQPLENLIDGSYELTVMDAAGCEHLEQIDIQSPAAFSSGLPTEVEVEWNENVSLVPLFNFTPEVTTWSFSVSGEVLTTEALNYTLEENQEVELLATTEEGCSFLQMISLRVNPDRSPVYIPNVFTPNGDGGNAYFEIFGSGYVEKIEYLRIYNRWGELVFAQEDYEPGSAAGRWDGRFRDKVLKPGVFVYDCNVIFKDGRTNPYKGDVLLLK